MNTLEQAIEKINELTLEIEKLKRQVRELKAAMPLVAFHVEDWAAEE